MAIGADIPLGSVGAGWLRLYGDGYPGHIYVRLEADERGRYRVHDFLLRGEWRHLYDGDLREMHLSRIEEWIQEFGELVDDNRALPVPGLDEFFAAFGPATRPRSAELSSGQRVPLLSPPEGRKLTDEFLEHVAAAYRQAVADGKPPAPELARQAFGDKSRHRTVHKWVYVARQRGILPAAARRGGRG